MRYIETIIFKWILSGVSDSIDLHWEMKKDHKSHIDHIEEFRENLRRVYPDNDPVILQRRLIKSTGALLDMAYAIPALNNSRGIVDVKSIEVDGHIVQYNLNMVDVLIHDRNYLVFDAKLRLNTVPKIRYCSMSMRTIREYHLSLNAKECKETMDGIGKDGWIQDFESIAPMGMSFAINVDSVTEIDILNDMCHE